MKQNKCPYWDEKEGKCTLETQLAGTPLGGEILPGRLQTLENLALKIFHPPTDSHPAYFGKDEDQKKKDEDQKKKQEYWDKELEKMDEGKGKK